MTQTTIDDFLVKIKGTLSTRDWTFYNFLKWCAEMEIRFNKHEHCLERYENWLQEHFVDESCSYGYFKEKALGKHYSDMSSARAMRKTIEKIEDDDTIQKVICGVNLAMSVEEAEKYLERQKIIALKKLKKYWKQVKKLERHHQMRFVNGKQRDYIEAVIENGSL